MDENGAQESHIDFYAQFGSVKPQTKKFLKSNHGLAGLAGLCTAKENQIWQ